MLDNYFLVIALHGFCFVQDGLVCLFDKGIRMCSTTKDVVLRIIQEALYSPLDRHSFLKWSTEDPGRLGLPLCRGLSPEFAFKLNHFSAHGVTFTEHPKFNKMTTLRMPFRYLASMYRESHDICNIKPQAWQFSIVHEDQEVERIGSPHPYRSRKRSASEEGDSSASGDYVGTRTLSDNVVEDGSSSPGPSKDLQANGGT